MMRSRIKKIKRLGRGVYGRREEGNESPAGYFQNRGLVFDFTLRTCHDVITWRRVGSRNRFEMRASRQAVSSPKQKRVV